jgi:hypothetical protein
MPLPWQPRGRERVLETRVFAIDRRRLLHALVVVAFTFALGLGNGNGNGGKHP